jgi:hypothetical protein
MKISDPLLNALIPRFHFGGVGALSSQVKPIKMPEPPMPHS